MNNNILYYNAPSREAIVRRIMAASGSTFNIDYFIAKDNYVPAGAFAGTYATRTGADFIALGQPIFINE